MVLEIGPVSEIPFAGRQNIVGIDGTSIGTDDRGIFNQRIVFFDRLEGLENILGRQIFKACGFGCKGIELDGDPAEIAAQDPLDRLHERRRHRLCVIDAGTVFLKEVRSCQKRVDRQKYQRSKQD